VTTNLFFAPLSSPSGTSARGSGTGTINNQPYNFYFTIDDRV
jgi:hypothetical protein